MQLQLAPNSFIEAVPVPPAQAYCFGRRATRVQYFLDSRRRRRHLGARPTCAPARGRWSAASANFSGFSSIMSPGRGSGSTTSSSRCSFSSPASRSCWRCRAWSNARASAHAHLRVLRRALLLYGLGLIYYGGISHHWADIRYLGVLQRIAICYLFASLAVPELQSARHDRRVRWRCSSATGR